MNFSCFTVAVRKVCEQRNLFVSISFVVDSFNASENYFFPSKAKAASSKSAKIVSLRVPKILIRRRPITKFGASSLLLLNDSLLFS